jgi:hypothetical protein
MLKLRRRSSGLVCIYCQKKYISIMVYAYRYYFIDTAFSKNPLINIKNPYTVLHERLYKLRTTKGLQ